MSNRYIIRHHKKQSQPNCEKIKKIIIKQFPNFAKSTIHKQFDTKLNKQKVTQKILKQLSINFGQTKNLLDKQNSQKQIAEIKNIKTERLSLHSISCPIKKLSFKKKISLNIILQPCSQKENSSYQKSSQSTLQSQTFFPVLKKNNTERNYKKNTKIAPVKLIMDPFSIKQKKKRKSLLNNNAFGDFQWQAEMNLCLSKISQIQIVAEQQRFMGVQSYQILNF